MFFSLSLTCAQSAGSASYDEDFDDAAWSDVGGSAFRPEIPKPFKEPFKGSSQGHETPRFESPRTSRRSRIRRTPETSEPCNAGRGLQAVGEDAQTARMNAYAKPSLDLGSRTLTVQSNGNGSRRWVGLWRFGCVCVSQGSARLLCSFGILNPRHVPQSVRRAMTLGHLCGRRKTRSPAEGKKWAVRAADATIRPEPAEFGTCAAARLVRQGDVKRSFPRRPCHALRPARPCSNTGPAPPGGHLVSSPKSG